MGNLQTDFMQSFFDALLTLDTQLGEFEDTQPTPEEAAQVLSDLHYIKSNFAFVYERMEAIVAQAMSSMPEVILPSGVKVEKKFASSRKSWQHKDLAAVVAERISDMSIDMDTGERQMSTQDMITKLLDYVQPSYWRVQALNSIGINPDRFCEVSEGKTSIIVRRGDTQ